MAINLVRVINRDNGVSGWLRADLVNHPFFGKSVVEYVEGSKEFVPETFKSRSAEDLERDHPKKVKPSPLPALAPAKDNASHAKQEQNQE